VDVDKGERLDRYLVRVGLAPSRRAARELIERRGVTINGHRTHKSDPVGPGDTVEVLERATASAALAANSELDVEVLYQDDSVLVVNKPGLMPCHPLRPGERGTVMNAVVARFPETAVAGDNAREGGLVHRLDNGTSGALIIARTHDAFARLRDAIRSGAVERRYEALVAGHVPSRLDLSSAIAHHPKNPRKMTLGKADSPDSARAGRHAITIVEPLRRIGNFSLVSVAPRTGSRHQIRLHLAGAGHPLAGDTLYGGPSVGGLSPGRFWLHLREVGFESPAKGSVTVEAPLPADLKPLLH
jgi:23S rRNA pseudouridine1911/1915/1917 synthase